MTNEHDIELFLSSLKKQYDDLRDENASLKERVDEFEEARAEILRLKQRLSLARKSDKTLRHVESLEHRVQELEGQLAESIALHQKAQAEIVRLNDVISDAGITTRLETLEAWVHTIAERLGIKQGTSIQSLMGAVSDAIRKRS